MRQIYFLVKKVLKDFFSLDLRYNAKEYLTRELLLILESVFYIFLWNLLYYHLKIDLPWLNFWGMMIIVLRKIYKSYITYQSNTAKIKNEDRHSSNLNQNERNIVYISISFIINVLYLVIFTIIFSQDYGNLDLWKSISFATLNDNFNVLFASLIPASVALVSAYLTYKVFRNQQTQGVINRYYEAIKFHKENVKELKKRQYRDNSKTLEGRRLFKEFYFEYKLIFKIVSEFYSCENRINYIDATNMNWTLHNISYLIFFYGISDETILENELFIKYINSDTQRSDLIKLFENICDYVDPNKKIGNLDEEYKNFRKEILENNPVIGEIINENKNNEKFVFNFKSGKKIYLLYKPFEGHNQRLGHYFRHLYGIAKMLRRNKDLHDPYYSNILRNQLGDYEQLFLYLNASSIMGINWFRYGFIQEFKLIHNMPYQSLNFTFQPKISQSTDKSTNAFFIKSDEYNDLWQKANKKDMHHLEDFIFEMEAENVNEKDTWINQKLK